MKTVLFSIIAFGLFGCGGVPFPACDTPEAVRCEGTEAQRCEGGHWYADLDCAEVGLRCEAKGRNVRCVR